MHIDLYDQERDPERDIPFDDLDAEEFFEALSEELSEGELPNRESFVGSLEESIDQAIDESSEQSYDDECSQESEGPAIPYHTVSTELLTNESGLLGETYKLCTATPSHKYTASNAQEDIQHIYVNGMNGDLVRFLSQLDWITRRLGQPVTAVINGQRSSPHQYFAAWMGIIRPELGHKFEYTGVSSLKDMILKNADQGISSRIFAHSHGAIIARVALGVLKKECSKEEWQHICNHVEVISLGCTLHDWPHEIQVTQYNHETDGVSGLTEKLSRIFHPRKRKDQSPLHNSVTIPAWTRSLSHNLYGYVTHFPDFFIAQHTDTDGVLDSAGLANFVSHSIDQGHYSDNVHRSLIRKMIEREDIVFLQQLLASAENGSIGAFQIPYKPAIRALGLDPDSGNR